MIKPGRDWTRDQYSPGGTCIDTNFPFRVNVSFVKSEEEPDMLAHLRTVLTQNNCSLTTRKVLFCLLV